MSASRSQVLGLYRLLLRQCNEFQSFNYRNYAVRRVRDYFREKRALSQPEQVRREMQYGRQSLEMLRRQTALSQTYSAPKLVVEHL